MEDDFASVNAGSGTDVHHIVGTANHVAVVFYHDNAVADVAQLFESVNESAVVALMEPDAGFIENVKNVHQTSTYLCGQPYAL